MAYEYIDEHEARTSKELIIIRVKHLLEELRKKNPQPYFDKLIDLLEKQDEQWISEIKNHAKDLLPRNRCAFCGSPDNLGPTRLVPRSRGGPLQPINLANVCSACAEKKGSKGVYEWWVHDEGKQLPVSLEILYLATLYVMHMSANTLNLGFNELHRYCHHCEALNSCPGELSTLCVEGVIALRVKR